MLNEKHFPPNEMEWDRWCRSIVVRCTTLQEVVDSIPASVTVAGCSGCKSSTAELT